MNAHYANIEEAQGMRALIETAGDTLELERPNTLNSSRALHLASYLGETEQVRLLLDAGEGR